MLEDVPEEYEIDPESDFKQLEDIFVEEFPDAVEHSVEDVIFADDGPVNHLTWIALDGYSRHEFFYDDDNPDSDTLYSLLSLSPGKDDMMALRAYLAKEFDVVKSLENAALLGIPDTYQPGSKAQAHVAFYRDPRNGELNVGLNATPAQKEAEILDDVNRLVPTKNLEKLIRKVADIFYDEVEQTARDTIISGDVLSVLDDDPDFRYQTTKPLPDGVNPMYRGREAQLWQKPISKDSVIEGSQGFIQIWVPEEEESTGFISVTNGEYDNREALSEVRTAMEAALN
ncbi:MULTISPECIES: hypothetical protein [Halomicrobium]|uniref:Uncharacterized protein n=2 Tax=Halomicrobium mukohataei TaxID=57705 RepID=C7NXZ3_HALMD|nr:MULTISPECIES: hypothetical protein [Halomicrobium]ACV46581.1 hypothetical protein Hmuk_0447 [Halomicrobium mukohataei DSM 12286]QCD65121.1 hypothetical protein E5139_05495 [Halomicrobium mukohataei]QFR19927.1 hypothetical protein GBQ70_05490 [Halomicrobium sp. ZPS1]